MTDFFHLLKIANLQADSRATRCELVDRLISASVKTSHHDGIKAQQNTFQSTKSTVDLVDKNNTAESTSSICLSSPSAPGTDNTLQKGAFEKQDKKYSHKLLHNEF